MIKKNEKQFMSEGSGVASDLYMCACNICVGRIHLIPFLWSNAGIMEAGCSDIRATNSWRTSWIFSSCRGKKIKEE